MISSSPLATLIAEEIRTRGPIGFDRFMELALYHPLHGYYTRKDRDPFGKGGDFYTASQLQPVFGRAIARAVRGLRAQLGNPEDFMVVELGAGRGEMAEALAEFHYVPVEAGSKMPEKFTGVVFSNEFFDALPVRVAEKREEQWRERLVTVSEDRFLFTEGPPVCVEAAAVQSVTELHDAAVLWMKMIANRLSRGFVLTIDYGYTSRERSRFPRGTLMSYRSHMASEDVLSDPGERDITSHVPFDALRQAGEECGLETVSLETLSQFLLRLGAGDQFADLVKGGGEAMLKTLIYGMGESFRVLLQKKLQGLARRSSLQIKTAPIARGPNKNGPDRSGPMD